MKGLKQSLLQKDEQMSKKQKSIEDMILEAAGMQEPSKEQSVTISANLTETALGIAKDPLTGKWNVVTIKFDPENRIAGPVEMKEEEDRQIAVERFKIFAANDILTLK